MVAAKFQLVIDCADPEPLARFWAAALGYVLEPPPAGFASWDEYWRDVGVPEDELGPGTDSIVDPDGRSPRIWFQVVPERKAVKNRLHIDVHASGGRGSRSRPAGSTSMPKPGGWPAEARSARVSWSGHADRTGVRQHARARQRERREHLHDVRGGLGAQASPGPGRGVVRGVLDRRVRVPAGAGQFAVRADPAAVGQPAERAVPLLVGPAPHRLQVLPRQVQAAP